METIIRFTKHSVVLFAMILSNAVLYGGPVYAMADGEDISVGDVYNSECAKHTRSESVIGRPTLKLTRFEGGLYGELINYEANCAYGDVSVECQAEGKSLKLLVDEGNGELFASCICPINIYFTIFNAVGTEYQLTFGGRNIGEVSFANHSVVEIDLTTLAQAYEEGFEYPVAVQHFWSDEITNNIKAGAALSPRLQFSDHGVQQLHCVYSDYVLPCEYSVLDVKAERCEDGTVVLNVITDGIPGQGCKRVSNLSFDIVNILPGTYKLRLNHIILVKDDEGHEHACSVCLYDGSLTMSLYAQVTIPIDATVDYNAIVADIMQLKGNSSEVPLFDLSGRRLAAPPTRGLYIEDGKVRVK